MEIKRSVAAQVSEILRSEFYQVVQRIPEGWSFSTPPDVLRFLGDGWTFLGSGSWRVEVKDELRYIFHLGPVRVEISVRDLLLFNFPRFGEIVDSIVRDIEFLRSELVSKRS